MVVPTNSIAYRTDIPWRESGATAVSLFNRVPVLFLIPLTEQTRGLFSNVLLDCFWYRFIIDIATALLHSSLLKTLSKVWILPASFDVNLLTMMS